MIAPHVFAVVHHRDQRRVGAGHKRRALHGGRVGLNGLRPDWNQRLSTRGANYIAL